MEIFTGDFKKGLEQLLQQTHVQAIILGTRRCTLLRCLRGAPPQQHAAVSRQPCLGLRPSGAGAPPAAAAAPPPPPPTPLPAQLPPTPTHTTTTCPSPSRGDPNAADQETFCPSSVGWPAFMRVNPILEWSYHDVWGFLQVGMGRA